MGDDWFAAAGHAVCAQISLSKIAPWYKVKFQTKLEQGAALVEWAAPILKNLGKTPWVAADGAYAKRPLLQRMLQAGVVVVSRLRKDAALWSVPEPVPPGQRKRGKPRKYGTEAISLAKRAGHRHGWQQGDFVSVRRAGAQEVQDVPGHVQAGRRIDPVPAGEGSGPLGRLLLHPGRCYRPGNSGSGGRPLGHRAEFPRSRGSARRRPAATANYWANIAAYHVTLWWHTLIELWAWYKPHEELTDRSASPWDNTTRRLSHADRRNAMRRHCLEYRLRDFAGTIPAKIRHLCATLVKLLA